MSEYPVPPKLNTRLRWKMRLAPLLCPLISGSIPALGRYFYTDKQGPHKWGAHRYCEHYQLHLRPLRFQPLRILEIGVGGYDDPSDGAASLRMWKYFFPRAHIAGLDIEDKRHFEESRIRIYHGSQTDEAVLRQIVADLGGLDLIIDDGSHVSAHIIETFGVLFPLLSARGLYCIEDLLTAALPEFGGGPECPETSVQFISRLANGLQYEDYKTAEQVTYTDRHIEAVHLYRNLAIIQKGVNADGGILLPAR